MSITKERRLLQSIHQNARINKSCSECVHEGDFTICCGCEEDPKHKRWEWRWEEKYRELRQQVEEAFADRPKRRRNKCLHRNSPKKKSATGK